MPQVQALNLALQTRVPSVKSLRQHLCLRTMGRRIEPGFSIQGGGAGLRAVRAEAQRQHLGASSTFGPHPSPRTPPFEKIPIKQPQSLPLRDSICSRSQVQKSPFSHQRMKVSFLSDLGEEKNLHDVYMLSEGK